MLRIVTGCQWRPWLRCLFAQLSEFRNSSLMILTSWFNQPMELVGWYCWEILTTIRRGKWLSMGHRQLQWDSGNNFDIWLYFSYTKHFSHFLSCETNECVMHSLKYRNYLCFSIVPIVPMRGTFPLVSPELRTSKEWFYDGPNCTPVASFGSIVIKLFYWRYKVLRIFGTDSVTLHCAFEIIRRSR